MFAAFGGLLFGWDTGNLSGILAMSFFNRTFGEYAPYDKNAIDGYLLSTGQKSLITSILSAGTFCGALLGAPTADLIGRRRGIMASMAVFSVGVALQTAATSLPVFVPGRLFAGLGVGLVSTMVPMYQSECAKSKYRGAIVSCYQWFITIGLLLAAVATYATKDIDNALCYRIPIGLQFAWAAILVGGFAFMPESPRWLVKQGRFDEAANALARLDAALPGDHEVLIQLDEIRSNYEAELEAARGHRTGWLACFDPSRPSRRLLRTVTGMGLQACQQASGVNFVFYYGTTFFKSAGVSNPFTTTIIVNLVNVFATIAAFFTVDKFGRRKLLLVGALGMTASEFIIAVVGATIAKDDAVGQKVLIAFTCTFIAFFASTWGPVAWVVVGECFDMQTRAKGMALSAASNWLWNFAFGYATPYLVDDGPGDAGLGVNVFWIWGTTCALAGFFCFFFVPETKGLTLEEVDELYATTSPRRSPDFVPAGRKHGFATNGARGTAIELNASTTAVHRAPIRPSSKDKRNGAISEVWREHA